MMRAHLMLLCVCRSHAFAPPPRSVVTAPRYARHPLTRTFATGSDVGAVEGISYLAVIGIAGASVVTKVKTGSGLPAGPGGLLGLAEGLAYTAIAAGIVVLGFQLGDYGYLPNVIPVEGGRCE